MFRKVLFLVSILFPLTALSVTFEKTYPGLYGFDVLQTPDRGYIIVGNIQSVVDTFDLQIIKVDSLGNTLWIKTYSNFGVGYSICEAQNNCYIITGGTGFLMQQGNLFLMKIDSAGDTLWTKTYGAGFGRKVCATFDNGYIVAGTGGGAGAGIYVLKVNSSGNLVWGKHTTNEEGYGVCQTPDSGYMIAGATYRYVDDGTPYVMRLNKMGDTVWTRIYPPWWAGQCVAQCVEQTFDNNYIVGSTYNITKINSSGDSIWVKAAYIYISCVRQTQDNGFIVSGTAGVGDASFWNLCLVKLDSKGDTLWIRGYGGDDFDCGYAVKQTLDKGYIISGIKVDAAPNRIYLIKTDSFGNVGIEEKEEMSNVTIDIFPNPCFGSLKIKYNIPMENKAMLYIYDVSGREIKNISDGNLEKGMHTINTYLPPGIYFMVLQVGGQKITNKLVVINGRK